MTRGRCPKITHGLSAIHFCTEIIQIMHEWDVSQFNTIQRWFAQGQKA